MHVHHHQTHDNRCIGAMRTTKRRHTLTHRWRRRSNREKRKLFFGFLVCVCLCVWNAEMTNWLPEWKEFLYENALGRIDLIFFFFRFAFCRWNFPFCSVHANNTYTRPKYTTKKSVNTMRTSTRATEKENVDSMMMMMMMTDGRTSCNRKVIEFVSSEFIEN